MQKYYFCVEEVDDGITYVGIVTAPFKWKARNLIRTELGLEQGRVPDEKISLKVVANCSPSSNEGVEDIRRFEPIKRLDFYVEHGELQQFKEAA